MLKIKDLVDLKELERFGFEDLNRDCWFLEDSFVDYIEIHKDTRELKICSINDKKINNTIFDLIQAGLVEKV